MRTINRPVPLICEICSKLIGPDEPCSWRERTRAELCKMLGCTDAELGAVMSPGCVARHDACGKLEHVEGASIVSFDPRTNTTTDTAVKT